MKRITWEVEYSSLPPVLKYCRKCGKKTEFICSRQFRVNAQRRYLDIWLIYKCSGCDTTWNAAVYSRISPQSLKHELLERFYKNDSVLAEQYAMDPGFLQQNKAEAGMPQYTVTGESFSPDEAVELKIKSKYEFPVKVSSVVREKLHLSHKEYARLIADGRLRSVPEQDLKKCRLRKDIFLVFQ